MENIINKEIELINENNRIVVSSRQVADNFRKQHKDVLDSIREILAAENSATRFFFKTEYENRGKKYPEYLMDRDGFTLLAMGFAGKKAMAWKLKYIAAFNSMEEQLKLINQDSYMIKDPVERAKKWVIEQEAAAAALKEKNKVIAQLEPKAQLADHLAGTKDWIAVGEVAKVLAIKGFGRNNLFRLLKARGVFMDSRHPYQRYVDAGYFKICERPYYNEMLLQDMTNLQIKVSQRGVAFIRRLVMSETDFPAA